MNFTNVWVHTVASTVPSTQQPMFIDRLRAAYPDDPEAAPIYAKCLGGELPDGFRLEGGLLFKEQREGHDKLFIPAIGRVRMELVEKAHDVATGGHLEGLRAFRLWLAKTAKASQCECAFHMVRNLLLVVSQQGRDT